MDKIIQYLTDTYHPNAIILYGSYQDGTQDDSSDFDCMLLVSLTAIIRTC